MISERARIVVEWSALLLDDFELGITFGIMRESFGVAGGVTVVGGVPRRVVFDLEVPVSSLASFVAWLAWSAPLRVGKISVPGWAVGIPEVGAAVAMMAELSLRSGEHGSSGSDCRGAAEVVGCSGADDLFG